MQPTRTALVTGGNRGIGLATCEALAARGVRVLLGSRDAALGEETAAALRPGGYDVASVVVDVADATSIDACVARLSALGRRVDILVNNAGVLTRGDALETPDAAFREAFDVHVLGPLRLCRALIPAMRAAGWGRVVNVSSGYGSFGEQGLVESPASYGVTKAALNAFTVSLAATAGPQVKVNAVCPGWVRTRMGGPEAHRSVQQAADGIVWAALLPDDGPTGGFFRDVLLGGGPGTWFALSLKGPLEVTAALDLLRGGLDAEIAEKSFTTSTGKKMPAGSLIFSWSPGTVAALQRAANAIGFDIERSTGKKPATTKVTEAPKVAVLTSSSAPTRNDKFNSLERIFGSDVAFVTTPALQSSASDPLEGFDVIFNNGAVYPPAADTIATARLQAFFARGGGYIGTSVSSSSPVTSARSFTFLRPSRSSRRWPAAEKS